MSRSASSVQPSWRLHLQRLVETWTGPSHERNSRHRRDLVGIDVTDGRLQSRPTLFIPLLIGSLIAALFLVGLRNDLTAMRYDAADALAQEEQLRAEKRTLTVEMRRLRDPNRLAVHARELGFVRPQQIVDLRVAAEQPSPESQAAEQQSRDSQAAQRRSRESQAAQLPGEQNP